MTKEERSIRQEIENWLTDQMEGLGSFRLPDLVDNALTHFSKERGFAQRFVKALARPMLYTIGVQLISARRGGMLGDIVVNPDDLDSTKALAQPDRINKWLNHYEHCGDQYVNIMEVTKAMGKLAIKERHKRAGTELAYAHLIEQLIKKLNADQVVGDRWTVEQIDNLFTQIREAA